MSMHYVMNVESNVDGDTASAIAMWFNVVQMPDAQQVSQFGGRWNHELVRTGSVWCSRKLRLEVVW